MGKKTQYTECFRFVLDWSCFPKELMPQKRKPWVKAGILESRVEDCSVLLHKHKSSCYTTTGAKKTKTVQGKDTKDVLTKLDVSLLT